MSFRSVSFHSSASSSVLVAAMNFYVLCKAALQLMKEAFETRSVDAMLIRVFMQWMAVSSVVASPNAQGRNRCRRRYHSTIDCMLHGSVHELRNVKHHTDAPLTHVHIYACLSVLSLSACPVSVCPVLSCPVLSCPVLAVLSCSPSCPDLSCPVP